MSETLQGHRTKFKKERKANKTTESPTVSSRGQTTVIGYYDHDRLVIVKLRPEKYRLQLAAERQRAQTSANATILTKSDPGFEYGFPD